MTSSEDRFNDLYRSNRIELLNYFLRRTGNAEKAADCLAQTFLVIWRRIDDVPQEHEARLWIYGVARNILFDAKRSDHRYQTLVGRIAGFVQQLVTVQQESGIDEELEKALQSLSTLDREIILLTSWEGLAPSEIAVVLDMNPNTVRTRLSRARTTLKEKLLTRDVVFEDI